MITEPICTIYKITNKINNFIYVGSTTRTIEERFIEHFRPSKWEDNPNSLFYADVEKYGKENFKVEALDTCFERHRFIIEEYWWNKLHNEKYLMYDIKRGSSHSSNTKQRLSDFRNRNERTGIYKSEQFKEKISEKTSGVLNGMWDKKDEDAINGRMVHFALSGGRKCVLERPLCSANPAVEMCHMHMVIAFKDKEHTEIFKEFVSVKTALSFLGIKGHLGLNKACRKNTEYHGYYWTKEWIDR